jgi:hypothetical protein
MANIKRLFAEGVIGHTARDVGLQLLSHVGENGRCDPGRARLASLTRRSLRTIDHALSALRATKILSWARRIQRTKNGAKQTSSAYRFAVTAFDALSKALAPKTKQPAPVATAATPSMKTSNFEAAREMAKAATMTLAEVRERMQMRYAQRAAQ